MPPVLIAVFCVVFLVTFVYAAVGWFQYVLNKRLPFWLEVAVTVVPALAVLVTCAVMFADLAGLL